MNIILPKIPSTFMQSITAVSNIGYSFNKESIGRKPGNSSLNNSAISIIDAYYSCVTNNYEYAVASKSSNINTSNQHIESSRGIPFIISKPTFNHTNSKVTIQLFYYIPLSHSV